MRNLKVLQGKSGIQDYWQEIQDYAVISRENSRLSRLSEMSIAELPFTGVQYHTVVIIVDAKISQSGYYSQTLVDDILYHTVSRALRRLIVLCHKTSYDWISRTLSLDSLELSVFMKMKSSENISEQDFSLIKTREELEEALEILIITKNYTVLNSLMKFHHASNLLHCLSLVMRSILEKREIDLEEHELLAFLNFVLQPDVDFEIFTDYYVYSAKYAIHSFGVSKMRKLFPTPEKKYHAEWTQSLSCRYGVSLWAASVIWCDSKVFFFESNELQNCNSNYHRYPFWNIDQNAQSFEMSPATVLPRRRMDRIRHRDGSLLQPIFFSKWRWFSVLLGYSEEAWNSHNRHVSKSFWLLNLQDNHVAYWK